jgi:hypothetical protein
MVITVYPGIQSVSMVQFEPLHKPSLGIGRHPLCH